ncbi:MAG: hypothetical protein PHN78_03075, partial [Dehalococcoidales bacterium]|nr:hypothetical protein [Dehalococcoidales bacterium]
PEGTYDLMVRIDDFADIYAEVAGCVEITSGASDMTGMRSMVMMLAMMGMVVPMMTEGVAE